MKRLALQLFGIFLFMGNSMPLHAQNYDYLIRNAVIYDGISAEAKTGDVALKDGRIAALGDLAGSAAVQVVDAQGLVLAPGFIDAHTHSDFNPEVYPDLPNKIMQGVTTEVTGNCGMSAAPVLGTHGARLPGIWAREGVQIPAVNWKTFQEYRGTLEKEGMQTNFVGLVGHGNLRSAVMGFEPRPATPEEIKQMKNLLADAMAQGARGISYGLIYLPGVFAQEDELVELCREAGKHDGVCAFHIRSEGSGLIDGIREAIRVGRMANAPVQISHLKAAGRKNWDKIDQALKLIEGARHEGVQITADVYPYTATSAELGVILPDAIYQREDRTAILRDKTQRAKLTEDLKAHFTNRGTNWNAIMLASIAHSKYEKFQGRTVQQAADSLKQDPVVFLIDLLADTNFEVSSFNFAQSEDVVSQVIGKPFTAIGSDSVADGSAVPHPRAFGSFPKLLHEYVAEKKMLTLGQAIQKVTSHPADAFHLADRGRIQEGFAADLVLFDPKQIKDEATYDNPRALASGVKWVFVNGRPAVQDGKYTGQKAGKFLS